MLSLQPAEQFSRLLDAQAGTLEQAQEYCRKLARSHYENFLVATCFVPRSLRQHFYNVYAFCRLADDLADETGSSDQSLELLDRWQTLLEQCYSGSTRHPVFFALTETIERFDIPIEPFADLLIAFRQDQTQTRYASVEDLLGYCRYSANPVGRLVLHLGECHSDSTVELSDSICTGLQLANFCQDVARDFAMGRIYLPAESFDASGYDQALLSSGVENDGLRQLMQSEVDRAESFLRAGWPLVRLTPKWLALDVAMFIEGGLEVLRQIRRRDFRVLSSRATVSKRRQLMLLIRCSFRQKCGTLREAPA